MKWETDCRYTTSNEMVKDSIYSNSNAIAYISSMRLMSCLSGGHIFYINEYPKYIQADSLIANTNLAFDF